MAQKQIAWNNGSGYIKLTYTGQGNGTITVDSDPNDIGVARSQVVTVQTVGGVVTKNLTVRQGACPFPVGYVQDFGYTGAVQSVTLPPGKYKLQCWGAQGGNVSGSYIASGSKGGYSEGVLTINQEKTVYIFVGGKGTDVSTSTTTSGVVNGGWNGGGGSTRISQSTTESNGYTLGRSYPRGGGGGTDIALVTSSMSYSGGVTNRSAASLLSRMIVAGGGGGASANYYEQQSEQKQVTETITSFSADGPSITYSTKKWANSANYLGTIIDVTSHRGETCEFTAGPIGYTVYTFAKTAPVVGNDVDYATGYGSTGYNTMDAAVGSVTVPSDASYLWVQINGGNTSGGRKPSKVEFSKMVTVTTSGSNVSSGKAYGGGVSGGGYLGGGQNVAGSFEAGFGVGAKESATSQRFATGGGGGGWYGGGRNTAGTSPSSYVDNGGGGSGFVNTAENAQYRPTGYTGLQLDSGETMAGNTSFPAPSGGNETGHAGNGYARITRLQ